MKAFINGLYLEFPEGQFSASRSNMEEGSFFYKKKKIIKSVYDGRI